VFFYIGAERRIGGADMDFKELQFVIAIAQEKKFTRAAEKLFYSQPHLSQTISRLEAELNMKLFDREHNKLTLTRQGWRFVRIAENILLLKEKLDQEISNIVQMRTNHIRFGTSHYYGSFLVTGILYHFMQNHPDIKINVYTETSQVLEKKLLKGDLDLAVIVMTKPHPELEYTFLFHEKILLALSPDNPICNRTVAIEGSKYPYLDPELLLNQSFILSDEGMRLRQSAEAFFEAEGIQPNIAVVTSSIESANRLAAYNVGAAFIPTFFIQKNRNEPLPRYFTTSSSLADWTVTIAHRKGDKYPNRLIKPFVEAMLNGVADAVADL